MNRREINQALAKALAYANCGKFDEAQQWGEILIRKLELAGVFKAGGVKVSDAQTLWTDNLEEQSEIAREQ
jgi:hypothetical protein